MSRERDGDENKEKQGFRHHYFQRRDGGDDLFDEGTDFRETER
jgi:hypothetical protein